MITERMLKKWRRETLVDLKELSDSDNNAIVTQRKDYEEFQTRILRMTQELLDQHLLRKETR